MAIQILMPALSPTMTEGTLARWHVKEGDEVRSGDVIAEIETDKATMEVEALDDGQIGKIIIAEGTQNVAVNAVIALLAEEGESLSEADIAAASAMSDSAADASPSAPHAAAPEALATPAAPATPAPSQIQAPQQQQASGNRIFATPLASRIASERGIELSSLTGTGPHGRILKADVEEAQQTSPQTASAQGVSAPAQDRFVPHTAMRRVIADRLQLSKQNAPHFYLTMDCEIDQLLDVRKQLNAYAPEGVKISVNDMVIKAAAYALLDVPEVNGYFEDEGCRYFADADISMAVAIDGGLVTPVITGVNRLGLADIARRSADLASRARSSSLDPSEYAGGGFTISNLGMFGIREFAAVINPPQSAILAVGAGEQRPVVRNGELAVATVMTVTLSADHRIVDGAVGARWLQSFKSVIEQPALMLM